MKYLRTLLFMLMATSVCWGQQFPEKWPQINNWMQASVTNLIDGGVVTNEPTLGYVQPLGSNTWKIFFPVAGVVTQVVVYVAPPKYLNVSGGLLTMSGDPTSGVNVVELIPATLTSAGFIGKYGTPELYWDIGLGYTPIRLRKDADGISVRNSSDSEYRDLVCRNLFVFGTNNIVSNNIVNIETNRITMNSNYTNGVPFVDAYLSVSRGSSPTANVQWVEGTDEWYLGYDGQMYSVGHYATQAVANAWPQIKTFDASACTAVSNQWPWIMAITPAQIYNWDTIHVWSTNETIDTVTNMWPWISTWYPDWTNWLSTNKYYVKTGDTLEGTMDANSNTIRRIALANFTNDQSKIDTAVEGDLWYDYGTGTLNFRGRYLDTTIQFGLESLFEAINVTGTTLTNGEAVYISGGFVGVGTDIKVDRAYIDGDKPERCVGLVTTTNIVNGATGLVTQRGIVNGLNTSAWTNGTDLYLSTEAGKLTNVWTEVYVGTVKRQHATTGQIWVSPAHSPFHNEDEIDPKLTLQNNATLDPTGFESADNIWVGYDYSTRKVTLTNATPISVWWRGTNVSLSTNWVSSAHPTNVGLHYLAMRTSTNIEWSLQPWTFDMAQVSIVYYNGAQSWGLKEMHGCGMDWNTHEELHEVISTFVESGIELIAGSYALQNGGNNTNVTPRFSAGILQDEDNHTLISATVTGKYTRVFFNANGSPNITTNNSYMVQVTGTYPDINTWNGTVFATNEASANQFFNIWVGSAPMAGDAKSQEYRVFVVQPQDVHPSLADAQAETTFNLNMSGFDVIGPEYVFRYKITGRTSASYGTTGKWRIEAVELLTGSARSQVSISGATAVNTADAIAVNVTGFTNNLSASDTTVQNALQTLDALNDLSRTGSEAMQGNLPMGGNALTNANYVQATNYLQTGTGTILSTVGAIRIGESTSTNQGIWFGDDAYLCRNASGSIITPSMTISGAGTIGYAYCGLYINSTSTDMKFALRTDNTRRWLWTDYSFTTNFLALTNNAGIGQLEVGNVKSTNLLTALTASITNANISTGAFQTVTINTTNVMSHLNGVSNVAQSGLSTAITATNWATVTSNTLAILLTNAVVRPDTNGWVVSSHDSFATNAGASGAGYYAMSNGEWTVFTASSGGGSVTSSGSFTNLFKANKNGTDQGPIANDTFTKLTFTNVVYNYDGGYVATNSRYTVSSNGTYQFMIAYRPRPNVDFTGGGHLYKNGELICSGGGEALDSRTGILQAYASFISQPIACTNGDYFEAYMNLYQTDPYIDGDTTSTFFAGWRLQ